MDSALALWEEKESSTPDEEFGSSAAGCMQHSQDIYWQARQKTPGLVRSQRPGATDSYEQKRPTHQRVMQTRSTRSTTAAYKDAYRLLQKRTRALKSDWWERKAVELLRAADRNDMKGPLQWTKGSVGTQEEGTCSTEINRWNGDLHR